MNKLITNSGTIVEDFENPNNWNLVGVGASKSLDTVNFRTGSGALKVTAVGVTAQVRKTVSSLDFSSSTCVRLSVYVYNKVDTAGFTLFLSNDTGYSNFFYWSSASPPIGNLKTGWNEISVAKSAFTSSGSPSWSSPILSVQLLNLPVASHTSVITFDSMRSVYAAIPVVILTFDDEFTGAYTKAYPIMAANNQAATMYVHGNWVGTAGHMSAAELQTLHAAGWDIGNHTWSHPDLTQLTSEEIIAEVEQCATYLESLGFHGKQFAYPYGAVNDTVYNAVKPIVSTARTVQQPFEVQAFIEDFQDLPWFIKCFPPTSTTPVATILTAIDRTIENCGLLSLLFHDVVDSIGVYTYDYLTSDFQTISDYLKTKSDAGQLVVMTIDDYQKYYLQIAANNIAYDIKVVDNNLIYTSGSYLIDVGRTGPTYWRNSEQFTFLDSGADESPATGISIDGEDIYISSYDLITDVASQPFFYKNDTKFNLDLSTYSYGITNGLLVYRGNIFTWGNVSNDGITTEPTWWFNDTSAPIGLPGGEGSVLSAFVAPLSTSTPTGLPITYSTYVAGDNILAEACYWKDGDRIFVDIPALVSTSFLSDITLSSNGTVYSSGNYYPDALSFSQAAYWTNTTLHNLADGTNESNADAIYLYNNDVYVCGTYNYLVNNYIPCYWLNGAKIDLSVPSFGGITDGEAIDIYVDATGIYIAGYYIDDSTNTSYVCYWKNGVRTDLNTDANGLARSTRIALKDGDIYVVGCISSIDARSLSAYWINSNLITFSDTGADASQLTDIFIKDYDVYVSGWETFGVSGTPFYYKNKSRFDLDITGAGANGGFAYGIYVFGNTAFCAGNTIPPAASNKPCYWTGTVRTDLDVEYSGYAIYVQNTTSYSLKVNNDVFSVAPELGSTFQDLKNLIDETLITSNYTVSISGTEDNEDIRITSKSVGFDSEVVLTAPLGNYFSGFVIDVDSRVSSCYWSDNIRTSLQVPNSSNFINCMFLYNGTFYFGGFYWYNGAEFPFYFAGSERVDLSVPSASNNGKVTSMFVQNGIVYASGDYYDTLAEERIACYWVNGSRTDMPVVGNNTFANGISVTNGDVYVCGYYYDKVSIFPNVPCYWVNGTKTDLDGGTDGQATGISIDNGTVYISGYYASTNVYACYWIVGDSRITLNTTINSTANNIYVNNGIVYTCGYNNTAPGNNNGCYWIGTNRTDLDSNSSINSIYYSDGTVYTTGSIVFEGYYWTGTTKTILSKDVYDQVLPSTIIVDGSTVYVAGSLNNLYENVGALWTNNVISYLTNTPVQYSIAVSIYKYNSDLHIAGNRVSYKDIPCRWINGVRTNLYGGGGLTTDLTLANGSEYISGYVGTGAVTITPCYWKDTVKVDLDYPAMTSTFNNAISVDSATDTVYCGGYYNNGIRNVPCYWTNTTRTDLSEDGIIEDVVFYNEHVYSCGSADNNACYWTDSTKTNLSLPVGVSYSNATAITIKDGIIYIAGYSATSNIAFYWVDGVRTDIADNNTILTDIFVLDGNIYVSGSRIGALRNSCYWINGVRADLETNLTSQANGVFIEDNKNLFESLDFWSSFRIPTVKPYSASPLGLTALVELEDIVLSKLNNPSTLPTGNGNKVAISQDEVYFAVAHEVSPFVSIYKQVNDVLTKLSDPSILPTGIGRGAAFSTSTNFLAIAHSVSPYITIYERSADTFTKLANPAILPAGNAYACAFSYDDTYLAVAHDTSPYLTIYKRSGSTFTKLNTIDVNPISNCRGCAWSFDGIYLVVTQIDSPYMTIYKRTGDNFVLLANPTTLPTGSGAGCAFSYDDGLLTISHFNYPAVSVYLHNGDNFEIVPFLSPPPTSSAKDCSLSQDGNLFSSVVLSNPYVDIYRRNNYSFFQKVNPAILPTSTGNGCAFSYGNNYLAVSHNTSPYLTVYKIERVISPILGGIASTTVEYAIIASGSAVFAGIATTSFEV